jgi:Amt family ammonium transporter
MSEEQLLIGDDLIHGEAAYVLGPCEAHEHLLAGNYIKRSNTGPGELSMGGVTMGHDPHAHAHTTEHSREKDDNEIKSD